MPVLVSILLACFVVSLEVWHRQSPSWWYYGVTPVGAVLSSLGFYWLQRHSPNLPATFVFFSVSTLVIRTVISLALGHKIGPGTWFAIVCMALATAGRLWRP